MQEAHSFLGEPEVGLDTAGVCPFPGAAVAGERICHAGPTADSPQTRQREPRHIGMKPYGVDHLEANQGPQGVQSHGAQGCCGLPVTLPSPSTDPSLHREGCLKRLEKASCGNCLRWSLEVGHTGSAFHQDGSHVREALEKRWKLLVEPISVSRSPPGDMVPALQRRERERLQSVYSRQTVWRRVPGERLSTWEVPQRAISLEKWHGEQRHLEKEQSWWQQLLEEWRDLPLPLLHLEKPPKEKERWLELRVAELGESHP